jgi:glycosyltransferase involved in cell wall biosynthesis
MAARPLAPGLEPLPVPAGWRPWPPELDPAATVPATASTDALPVSVVIPAYNREALISRALASVVAQRPSPAAEVIVVDDGSTDRTAAVAGDLGARVIRLEHNSGAATARNAGIQAATQPWVALLDSDDEWLPHLLASLWPLRGDHVLVTGSSLHVGDDPSRDRIGGPPARSPMLVSSPAALVFPHNFIASSGVLVRRDAILAAGGYRTDLRYAEDFDLWLRVLEQGTGVVSPAVVSIYHTHGGQKSRDVEGPRAAQRAAVSSRMAAAWWSPELFERRIAADAWDDLRGAIAQRRWVSALGHARTIVRRLVRVRAAADVASWRRAQRRRSAMVARDGGPTVGLLPGAMPERAGDRPVVDLRGAGWPAILATLVWRPPGAVACSSGWVAALARRLGSEPI